MSDHPTASSDRVTAVIVGLGHRGMRYGQYSLEHPAGLAITAVVDPDPVRRARAAQEHDIPVSRQFASIGELTAAGPVAEAAINATMDRLHVSTSMELMEAGYHVLLEKPIGVTAEEMYKLRAAAQRLGRIVMVCHVLRYAPFYSEIKKHVSAGEIGELLNIQAAEHVGFQHTAMSYVRGKFNSDAQAAGSMLISKSCHDLDLITWLKGNVPPRRVSSFGSLMHFRPDRAPLGAGTRCLTDCTIESSCPYSARKHYIDQDLGGEYVWHGIEHLGPEPTVAQKTESLRTDNPYGRCVWHCDNTVVDHQSVLVEFDDGATATLNMIGNAAKACRTIHLIGTRGEIQGVLEDGRFTVRHLDPHGSLQPVEETVDVGVRDEKQMHMHGGGELRLVEDFVRVLRKHPPSLSTTSLEDSINGHLIGFAAERSRREHRWFEITDGTIRHTSLDQEGLAS